MTWQSIAQGTQAHGTGSTGRDSTGRQIEAFMFPPISFGLFYPSNRTLTSSAQANTRHVRRMQGPRTNLRGPAVGTRPWRLLLETLATCSWCSVVLILVRDREKYSFRLYARILA